MKASEFLEKFQFVFIVLVLLLVYNFSIADSLSEHYNLTIHKNNISFAEYDIWFSAIFLAPIIEESLFRLPLSENENLNWMLFFPFLIFSIVAFFTFQYFLIISILLFLYVVYQIFIKSNTFTQFYVKNKYLVIVFVSVAFSFAHIVLLSNEPLLPWDKLLLVLVAYFPISIALAYFRIKNGILTAILFHSSVNLSTIILNNFIY